MSASTLNADVSSTQVVLTKEEHARDNNTVDELVLRLRTPKIKPDQTSQESERRRVTFTADTVDNEHLGRLKSNCCCIYVPPRTRDSAWTSSYDEHETEHCRGHTISVNVPSADDTTVTNQSPQEKSNVNEPLLDENYFTKENVGLSEELCC